MTIDPTYLAHRLHKDFQLGTPTNMALIYDSFPSISKNESGTVSYKDENCGACFSYENATTTVFNEAQVLGRIFMDYLQPELSPEQVGELEEFALELLMPDEDFRRACWTRETDGDLDIEKVAQDFSVPRQVAVRNAQRLNIV